MAVTVMACDSDESLVFPRRVCLSSDSVDHSLSCYGFLLCTDLLDSMHVNNQVMRVPVNMDVLTEHHDFINVAKQSCDLLQRNTLSFRQKENGANTTQAGNDDEHEEETPSDVRKSCGGGLHCSLC